MKPWKFAILLVFAMTTPPSHAQNSWKDYLDAHNAARAEVGVGPMKWSATLEAYAINYANQRAGDCQLIHSQGPYGENIYIRMAMGIQTGSMQYDTGTMRSHTMTMAQTSAWVAWTACTTRRWCGAARCNLVALGCSATAPVASTSSHATMILLET